MEIDQLTGIVLDTSIKIHHQIGPGCFEKVYEEILSHELRSRKLVVERQQIMPIEYNGIFIKNAYRIDLLVENSLVIEVKSVERLSPVHFQQVITYLKLLNLKNGLLLNFYVKWMKEGFHRIFNNNGC